MKFSCEVSALLTGVQLVSRAIGSDQVLPILQNILLKTDGDVCTLSATNLEVSIITTLPIQKEEDGVITQYATLVNPHKVKKGLTVICYVSLKQHNKNAGARFIKSILEMHEVIECYNISGEFDFMLKVVAENMDDYYNFHVNKLSEADNIGHVQSVFVMGIIKQTHVLVY